MLGNRYFIARQFSKAIDHLEKSISYSTNPDKIKKKLVICYIQTGNIERALFHFHDLIRKDPKIIIDTDPYHDDCPCHEIIPNWEKHTKYEEPSTGYFESLAMLYLYCDLEKSIQYFQLAVQDTKYKTIISSILKILTKNIPIKS